MMARTQPPRFWGVGGEGTLERAEGTTPKVRGAAGAAAVVAGALAEIYLCGVIIEAPWLVNGGHGASLRHRCGRCSG
eukprot:COSAG01_NODE_1552_length_9933_cov_13.631483_8_plen_77_part_00